MDKAVRGVRTTTTSEEMFRQVQIHTNYCTVIIKVILISQNFDPTRFDPYWDHLQGYVYKLKLDMQKGGILLQNVYKTDCFNAVQM
jgi:hypothetical protein